MSLEHGNFLISVLQYLRREKMPEQEIGTIERISINPGGSGETISIPAVKMNPGATMKKNLSIHVMGPSTNLRCDVAMIEVNGVPVAQAVGPCFADIGWRDWNDVKVNDTVSKEVAKLAEGEAGG